jgi:hypothetical protein
MDSANDDRTDSEVGVVYCVEGISMVGMNYMERNFKILDWQILFPGMSLVLVGVSQLQIGLPSIRQWRQSTLPITFAAW